MTNVIEEEMAVNHGWPVVLAVGYSPVLGDMRLRMEHNGDAWFECDKGAHKCDPVERGLWLAYAAAPEVVA